MNSINTSTNILDQHTTNSTPTADNLVQNFHNTLPPEIITQIQNNFYIYSRDSKCIDIKLSNEVLAPVVQDIIDFLIQWSFQDIENKRAYRKQQLWILDEEKHRIVEKELDTNVWNWKNLVQEICDILHKQEALWYIPLSQFFDVPVVEEKDFIPSDIYYYKWIWLNILLTRQIVCEWYKYFDEYLDYITPEYSVALDWYAHGSRRYFKPFQEWYILCINKDKLHQHVVSLKDTHKTRNEEYYQINTDHKNELYLYHTIVPISCVDSIIKIPANVKNYT